MPKRTDLKTILIIGAGPIVIGQACEFDYSGAQACKALRDEGYRVVLVNSNPATIMTDPDMADAVYIEPINWRMVEKIIAKERPDALLPTMGGQTALNCALELADRGILEKYNVELIGASREAIRMAEDRELFRVAMAEIGLECPKAEVVRTFEQALIAQTKVGYPVARPGKANLAMSTNLLAERFGCVSMTLEMPFKDHDPLPDPAQGWSAERSAQLGRDCLAALAEIIDDV